MPRLHARRSGFPSLRSLLYLLSATLGALLAVYNTPQPGSDGDPEIVAKVGAVRA